MSPSPAPEPRAGVERCAAHPARPAVDRCPSCGRPRCGADERPGDTCTLCAQAQPLGPVHGAAGHLELLVRAALAADVVAVAWAYVTAEYVGASYFQYLAPALLGLLCGGAATAAAGSPRRGALLQRVRVAATGFALLGAALGFLLENTYDPVSLDRSVLLPYAITVAAAWFWTAPPRSRKSRTPGGAGRSAGAAQPAEEQQPSVLL